VIGLVVFWLVRWLVGCLVVWFGLGDFIGWLFAWLVV